MRTAEESERKCLRSCPICADEAVVVRRMFGMKKAGVL